MGAYSAAQTGVRGVTVVAGVIPRSGLMIGALAGMY